MDWDSPGSGSDEPLQVSEDAASDCPLQISDESFADDDVDTQSSTSADMLLAYSSDSDVVPDHAENTCSADAISSSPERLSQAFHLCFWMIHVCKEVLGFTTLSKSLLASHIQFSTHFSGIGCAEAASRMLSSAIQGAFKSDTSLREVSMVEQKPRLRGVLLKRSSDDVCCFRDILEYVPGLTLEELISDSVPFLNDKICLIEQHLDLSPRQCEGHGMRCARRHPHGDISGSCCQPWSRCGKRLGLRDSRSMLLLVWCVVQLHLLPEWILHECVFGFETSILDSIMGSRYFIWHMKVRPSDFGWTVCSRPRLYSLFLRKQGLRAVCDVKRLYSQLCEVCRNQVPSVQIPDCFIASEEELLAVENSKRLRRGLGVLQGARSASWQYLLTKKQKQYLAQYHQLWNSKKGLEASRDLCCIFDLTQDPSKRPTMTTAQFGLPCIRHSGSLLWAPCLQRWLISVELAAASGFAVRPSLANAARVELDVVSAEDATTTDFGNGMMTFSLSAVLCCLLACAQRI